VVPPECGGGIAARIAGIAVSARNDFRLPIFAPEFRRSSSA
jgi:hypothetical protein